MARRKPNLCKTENCRNRVAGRQFCSSCRSRKCRERDIIKHAYYNLKASAKRRNIEFTITICYFRRFCYRYDFIKNMGKKKHSYSVDRICNKYGYIPGNIQALTISENASKGTKVLYYDWYHRYAKWY